MKILKIYKDFMENDYKIIISSKSSPVEVEKIKDKEVEIKAISKKRSLSQNSYCWVLINKIAEVNRTSKEEVYFEMLKRYAPSERYLISADAKIDGIVTYYEKKKVIRNNGKEFIDYIVYKGSSKYDSKEMTIFVDGIISECKELDIETITPEEIKRLELI